MSIGKWKRAICYWQKFDCAAYDSGLCVALASTQFKRGRCPFYKTREQVALEEKRAKERRENEEYARMLRRKLHG